MDWIRCFWFSLIYWGVALGCLCLIPVVWLMSPDYVLGAKFGTTFLLIIGGLVTVGIANAVARETSVPRYQRCKEYRRKQREAKADEQAS